MKPYSVITTTCAYSPSPSPVQSLVEMMGFNDSRYQWAIDEHFKQKELEEEAQRQEQETDRELQSSSAA